MCRPRCLGYLPSWAYPQGPGGEAEVNACLCPQPAQERWAAPGLTNICTVSSPSPASRASMVNSTGRLAGMPEALRPGPLARTLLASWAGSTLILKGLEGKKGETVDWVPSHLTH